MYIASSHDMQQVRRLSILRQVKLYQHASAGLVQAHQFYRPAGAVFCFGLQCRQICQSSPADSHQRVCFLLSSTQIYAVSGTPTFSYRQ